MNYSKTLSLSKEPFRLWFEYLKRARAMGMTVSKDYEEWGDTSVGFKRWWDHVGSSLICVVANGVSLANTETMNDENYYLFAIPKHLSPRQTRDEAENLMKKLKTEHGTVTLNTRWRLDTKLKPHLDSYRAYIHALDCKNKLITQAIKDGKNSLEVTNVEVLAELRMYYIKKHERYKGKGDYIPFRLCHGGKAHLETDPKKIIYNKPQNVLDATQSVNAVKDYLKKAEIALKLVANGNPPFQQTSEQT